MINGQAPIDLVIRSWRFCDYRFRRLFLDLMEIAKSFVVCFAIQFNFRSFGKKKVLQTRSRLLFAALYEKISFRDLLMNQFLELMDAWEKGKRSLGNCVIGVEIVVLTMSKPKPNEHLRSPNSFLLSSLCAALSLKLFSVILLMQTQSKDGSMRGELSEWVIQFGRKFQSPVSCNLNAHLDGFRK